MTPFPAAWTAMFVFGTVLGVPGAVFGVPEVAERLQLTLVSRGTLISSLFLGLLVGSVLSGPLVDRAGRRRSLSVAAGLVAIVLPAVMLVSSVTAATAVLIALGLVASVVNTAANALVSELFPESRGHRMNQLALAVGLGGLAMAGAAALSAVVPWQVSLMGGGVLSAGVAVAAALAHEPRQTGPAAPRGPLVPAGLRTPMFGVLGLLVMLCGANEASIAGWTPAYLAGAGVPTSWAPAGLAGHWAGLILGRVVIGPRVDRRKEQAIIVCALAAAGAVALFSVATMPWLVVLMPALIGVAIAVLTPTTLALAGDRVAEAPGTVFGTMLALAQVGSMTAPALIGALAERTGLRIAILLLAGGSLGIAALGRWLASHAAPAPAGRRPDGHPHA